MRTVPRLLILALVATLLLSPTPARAQPRPAEPAQQTIKIPPDGMELFRALLNMAQIKPVKSQELLHLTHYDDVIVILLGDSNNSSVIQTARQAAANGGSVLIATDTHLNLDTFSNLEFFEQTNEARIQNSHVTCRDSKSILHGLRENCPFVVPISVDDHGNAPDPMTEPVWQIFNGDGRDLKPLTRIATNTPSYLHLTKRREGFPHTLARFPPNCWTDHQQRLPASTPFAAGGDGITAFNRPFRFLVLADHSVFINQMMLPESEQNKLLGEPGTDNLEFASRTIDYLRGPNHRKRCILYENGRLVERFDDLARAYAKTKPQIPIPQINKDALQKWLVDQGNALIDRLQTNNTLNNTLIKVGLPSIAWFLLLLASVYVCWFLVRRAFGARKPIDLPPPPTVAGAPSGPPGVFERRQKELLRRNNVYEPVRDLIREFFTTTGIHGEQGSKHPTLTISEEVRKPASLRQAIKDFWKLAYGPPQLVTVGRWRDLEPYFERLRQAHADGKWSFVLET